MNKKTSEFLSELSTLMKRYDAIFELDVISCDDVSLEVIVKDTTLLSGEDIITVAESYGRRLNHIDAEHIIGVMGRL